MGKPWSNARRVRAYLKKHRVNCPGCGYDLHGVERGACPECGRALLIEELVLPLPRQIPAAHTEGWNRFRTMVYWIGSLFIVVAVFFLMLTYPVWLQVRGVKWLAASVVVASALCWVLAFGHRAYTEGRWPEFERTMARDTVVIIIFFCGLGVLLWFLLDRVWV